MNFNSIKETKAYNIGFENGFNKAQNDIKDLENTMLQENAANEKQFFERKARDAQLIQLIKEAFNYTEHTPNNYSFEASKLLEQALALIVG